MTIGRVLGFVIGTILFGAGAKIGEICFYRAEEKLKGVLKSDEKKAADASSTAASPAPVASNA